MFLIRECPSCGRRVRFPIDRGKLRVRCTCGHHFIADPDDPGLYKNARFDLQHDDKKKTAVFGRLLGHLGTANLKRIRVAIITRLLSLKYKLQNFKLLPAAEQRRIAVTIIIILLALAILGRLLCGGSAIP